MRVFHRRVSVTAAMFWVVSATFGVAIALSGTAGAAENEPPPVYGDVESVVLYRDGALVTRKIPVADLDADEIIIDGLPVEIRGGSVFAEGDGELQIRGVRLITRPTEGEGRPEVAEIEREIMELGEEINRRNSMIELIRKQTTALDRAIDFGQRAADLDLARGVLDATALMNLIDGAAERRGEYLEKELEITNETKALETELDRLRRDRNLLSQSTLKQTYRAKVFVDRGGADGKRATERDDPVDGGDDRGDQGDDGDEDGDGGDDRFIRLRYMVDGCSWSPQYSVAATDNADTVRVRYGAVILQSSGEDWTDIELTLSTASPAVSAAGPTMTPLRVTARRSGGDDPFGNAPAVQQKAGGAFGGRSGMGMAMGGMPSQMAGGAKSKIQSLRLQQQQIENSFSNDDPFANNMSRDINLNRIAGEVQQIELSASTKDLSRTAEESGIEAASQTYQLGSPLSLASRRDSQLVEIADLQLDGELVYVATPLLSSFVYRQVELTNDSDTAFLQGPVTVYYNDRFVGGMQMPSTAVGQDLTIGLGADNQLRTRRQLVSKNETVQGGNKQLNYRYKLVLGSFRDRDTVVRLLDRIPVANQSREIKVTLGETSHPISEDALYVRLRKPMGILRWRVEVPTGARGSNAVDVTYDYVVELAQNQTLAVPSVDKEVATRDMDQVDMFFGGGMGGGGMGGGGNAGGGGQ